ncbi:MAG: DNA polymerase III subunit gamma/tau [Butyrivibrio sp.]|nr:DNA polymerase III subunit gamma/tau [Butyrivibrio sp.]MCR4832212.1 DNA polymerase III subunit gamma/tau [Butyrivibrio sp.]
MAYVALYRKFRPPVFEDVKGQDHIVTTLKNQIRSDRVGHAYLFCGTRGTGKTSVAKIFARAVNCEHPVDGSPCGECDTCKAIASGSSLNVIEIDAASNNGVDNIREIVDEVSYSPTKGKYKVYIIDEVHMLSTGAFNALLKTLEEPPSYVIFILATTEPHKIPITILSRCQRYDFHRITADIIEDRLKEVTTAENVSVEEKALKYIAKAADGSMRDSLSLLDQCIAFNYGQELTYDKVLSVLGAVDTGIFGNLFSYLYNQDIAAALNLLADVVVQGRELTQFVNDFVWYLRNLMLVRTSDQMEDVVDMSSDNLLALKEQATNTDMDTILRYIRIFSELSSKMRYATQKRILIEMEFIKICKPQMEDTRDSIEDRIRILEEHTAKADKVLSGIKSGKIAVAAAPGQSVSAPVEVKKLDHAVPDDIKRIVNEWGKYMMNMPQPDRGYLKNARLSIDNDDKLLIVIDNKTLAEHYHEEQYYQNLERFFEEQMGKQVDFEVRYLESEKRFEENYIDLASINFDIITEEEVSIPTTQETATDIEEASVSADVPEDISKDTFAEDDTVQPISTDGLAEGFDAINLDIDEEEDIIPPEALALSGAMQEDAMDDENAFEEKDDDDNQNE